MVLKQQKYDAVLIIGNGFDLNLGLKTEYSNFVLSDQFSELLLRNNNLAKHLKEINELKDWIDIEKELKNYSKNHPERYRNFFEDFKSLSTALQAYLNTIDFDNINKSSEAYKLISKIKKHKVLIIDFNYTPTISKICKEFEIDLNAESCNIEHFKIHGSLDTNDIIFGVEDSADIFSHHIFLKKSVNKNFNPINFTPALRDCKLFIVFGHSLGKTDHMYFDELFFNASHNLMNTGGKTMIFHHYGENYYYALYEQIDKLTRQSIKQLKDFNEVQFSNIKDERESSVLQ